MDRFLTCAGNPSHHLPHALLETGPRPTPIAKWISRTTRSSVTAPIVIDPVLLQINTMQPAEGRWTSLPPYPVGAARGHARTAPRAMVEGPCLF